MSMLQDKPAVNGNLYRGWLESFVMLLAFLLAILSAAPQIEHIAVGSGYLFAGLLPAVWGALRTPLPAGTWQRQALIELTLAGAFILLLPLAVGVALAALGQFETLGQYTATGSGVAALVMIAFANLIFPVVRLLLRVWKRWAELQRKYLALAITQAILNVTLLVALLIILAYVIVNAAQRPTFVEQPGAGPLISLINRLVTYILPVLSAFTVTSLVALVILVPLAAWFAYRVARRTTRRLEDLTAASNSLAGGNLSARVPIQGQDEIAQLQENFNQMAIRLEENHRALEAERSKVSDLLDSRRRLFAGVSHDLRTPIATIEAYLDSLVRSGETESPATWQQDVGVLREETSRLKRLLDDLFLLARTDADRLELHIRPIETARVLEEVAAAFGPYAWQASGLRLVCEIPPDLPAIAVDEARLAQAIGNLLRNAIHHTRPGGMVGLFAILEEKHICIDVRDTGEGIPQGDMAHIWEPFYRGSAQTDDHAGLGLALVKEWVERMGGSVQVESNPGEGSCFRLCFSVQE